MFTDAQVTSSKGGVEFLLKRAKQGASEVSVYASFWSRTPWWVQG